MYYQFELFRGCRCYRNNGLQSYGPEFSYSGIIHRSSSNTSWNSFSTAQAGCLSNLRLELSNLQLSNPNATTEMDIIEKIISRLNSVNETITKLYCDEIGADEMPI